MICRSSPGGKEEKEYLSKKEGGFSCDRSKKKRVANRRAQQREGEGRALFTPACTRTRVCLGVGGRGRFRQRL